MIPPGVILLTPSRSNEITVYYLPFLAFPTFQNTKTTPPSTHIHYFQLQNNTFSRSNQRSFLSPPSTISFNQLTPTHIHIHNKTSHTLVTSFFTAKSIQSLNLLEESFQLCSWMGPSLPHFNQRYYTSSSHTHTTLNSK